MAERQHLSDVVDVLEVYFEGLHHADSKKLAKVFHRDARYVNTVEGDYMNYSIPEYFDIVDSRESPASSGEARAERIISVEFGGSRMAFVKASMTMMGRDYLDFLTFTRDHDGWRIMSKVFSYIQNSQEV